MPPPSAAPVPAIDAGSASPGAARTLAILELLSAAGEEGLAGAAVARRLELPLNSSLRILEVLEERGYVERRGEDRRFVLTGRLLDLARPRAGDRSLAGLSFEPLCALRDRTGETAQLVVRAQDRGVVIEQAASRQAVKVLGEIGLRVPLYSCAPGKAILAALPAGELEAYLRRTPLKKYTRSTLATRRALAADLRASARRGYATDRAEGLEGIHCVGAAVRDRHGRPVAGVTVIAPAFRLREERFGDVAAHVRAAADEISGRIR